MKIFTQRRGARRVRISQRPLRLRVSQGLDHDAKPCSKLSKIRAIDHAAAIKVECKAVGVECQAERAVVESIDKSIAVGVAEKAEELVGSRIADERVVVA